VYVRDGGSGGKNDGIAAQRTSRRAAGSVRRAYADEERCGRSDAGVRRRGGTGDKKKKEG
jgi:hypothetical protein